MKQLLCAAAAAVLVGLACAAPAGAAVTVFSGFDAGANSPGGNANAAAAAFVAAVPGASLITFESALPAGVTLSGGATITSTPEGSPLSFYGGNTTPAGSKFLDMYGVTETFTFATPVSAFGFFVGGGQFAANVLSFTDGDGSHSISLGPDVTNGGFGFVGFNDPGASITSLQIAAPQDIIALDDVRYLAAAPAGPGGVPEPSAWALMIAGFGGLGLMLRRRSAIATA